MPYYGKHRTDDGYLKELPADAQPAFNPAKSFESNCMADNGRRFIYRGSTIPFAISKQEFGEPQVPVKHVVLPKNEPYKELVPFATVCAPTMKIMPYKFRAAPAVKPADLNPSCFPKDASCFITPFQG